MIEDIARSRRIGLAIAIAIIASAVFVPALRGEWVYDDHPLIEQNLGVHSFSAWTHWFTSDFWDVGQEATGRILYWRPIVSATYAVDWQIGGGAPFFFHLSNLLFEALVGALAFATLRRWVGATLPAFLATLLFVLHPTKAESVAWISGRTDVLCTLCILLATTGIARRLAGRWRSGLLIEVVGTALAYGCKEQAIVLPAFAAIEAWVAAGRPSITLATSRRIAIAAIPQMVVAIAYLGIRAAVLPIGASSGGRHLGLVDHILTVAETFGRDYMSTFAPHELSTQQGLVLARGGELVHSVPHVVLGVAGTALLIVAALALRIRWPVMTIGLGFYLFALLPTSNIRLTSLTTLASDRFLYLPILGLALTIGSALRRLAASRAIPLVAAVALALATLSLSHATDFVSEPEFWAREIELHPESTTALGYQLRTQLAAKRYPSAVETLGRLQAAHAEFDWQRKDALEFVYHVALVVSLVTPDLDTASLRAVDAFCQDVLEHRKRVPALDVRGVHMSIPMPRPDDTTSIYEAQLLALRAELHSRLGDDREAMRLALAARDACNDCTSFANMDALTRARAGDDDSALAILDTLAQRTLDERIPLTRENVLAAQSARRAASHSDGVAAAFSRADALAVLGLWGRAYVIVEAFRDSLETARRHRFAELAFRAGDAASARQTLARDTGTANIDSQIHAWAVDMGWAEPDPE